MHGKRLIALVPIITILILSIGSPLMEASPQHWLPANTNAPWEGRWIHTSVVFDGKIWIMGGLPYFHLPETPEAPLNDVWYSTDGEEWTNVDNAQWSARYGHVSVVFNNKVWIMGGVDGSAQLNDVWYSSDGVTWTQATSNAAWSPRSLPTLVVYDDKMWIMGGLDGWDSHDYANYRNDVWYSSDGVTWILATASANWSARTLHASVVFDNKMWIFGGRDGIEEDAGRANDVWYSTDGVNWIDAIGGRASWSERTHLEAVVFENKMWIIGGFPGYAPVTDMWYASLDGEDWWASAASSAWAPRIGHRIVVFNDRMWLTGGATDVDFYNDVWFSNPGAVPEIPAAEDPSEIILPLMGIGFSMIFMGFGYGLTRGKNILAAFVFLDIGFLTFWLLGILPAAMVVIGFLILILYVLHERGAI